MDNQFSDTEELKPDPDAGDTVSVDLGSDGGRVTIGDVDGDGHGDWIETIRPDGSSSTLIDTDASGGFDTELLDRDADMLVDSVAIDLDDNATPDVVQEDEDRDGRLEAITLVETGTTVRLDPDTGLVTSIEEGLSTTDSEPGRPMTADDVPREPLVDAPASRPMTADDVPREPLVDAPASRPTTADDVPPVPLVEAPLPVPAEATAEEIVVEADAVHGDPVADLQWAQIQSENGFCVPASVGMIVSEFTGIVQTESEMVGTAIDLNLLYGSPGAWIGMTTQGTVELLDHFSVDSHVEYGSLDDLRSYLDDGRGIVLMVDADELWTSSPDDVQLADAGADHAVVITGIDDERAVVTLNDPGQPNGAGWEISVADLMDAWDDSNYEMVVTDGTPQTDDAVHGSLSAIRHPVGYVLLPVVVREELLRRTEQDLAEETR
jgi:hypothetical protein